MWACATYAVVLGLASGEVFFSETFDEDWEERWVLSHVGVAQPGHWERSAGKWSLDGDDYMGLRASTKTQGGAAIAYAISAQFTPFSNMNRTLIIQFQLKNEPDEDDPYQSRPMCGDGHIRLGPPLKEQKLFQQGTEYYIKFGPEIKSSGGKSVYSRTSCEFFSNGEHVEKTKALKYRQDEWQGFGVRTKLSSGQVRVSHLYTLTINPNGKVRIGFDGKKMFSGSLAANWNMKKSNRLKIDDPIDLKPADWVDEKEIPDPRFSIQPDWWDNREKIPKPGAEKRSDWDDDEDGEWEAVLVDNPRYRGKWKPLMQKNPEFRGAWRPRMIKNPKYVDEVYALPEIGHVGLLWNECHAGLTIDNIIITDDKAEADKFAEKWRRLRKFEDRQRFFEDLPEEDRELDIMDMEQDL